MKIEKLAIYGFGKHENLTIPINEDIAVFYGNNEAGKTTIQQFIVQLLFGFPSKNQAGNRYEPKAGGKYGGQLHLVDEQYGKLIIERVKGKAAGDVTVYFEDGSRGSELELKKILRNYDRTSFESIFSFSIHELQGLDKMTEEQLSRTLLASGTTGVDAITQMETELEKDMAGLFKKGGRNPQLNQLIDELRNDEKELKKHREQADLYGPYLEQLEAVNKQLAEMADQENSISRLLAEAGKQQQAAPLIEKKRELEQQLSSITVNSFPADGSRRMDVVAERISTTAAKKKLVDQELANLPEIEETASTADGLDELLERESDWYRLLSATGDAEKEAEKLQEDLDRNLGLIGMTVEEALQFDISLVHEEKLMMLAEKAKEEEEAIRFRDRELQDEKKKLIAAEKEISYLESIAPTEQEQDTAAEWPAIASKLAEAKAVKRLGNKTENHSLSYILLTLGLAGVLTGMWRGDFIVALLASGAILAGLWTLLKGRKKADSIDDVDDIISRYSGKEAEMESLQLKIMEHDRKVEDILQTISKADKKIEALEKDVTYSPAKKELEEFLQHLGVSSTTTKHTVLELFKTIRKVQEIHAKLIRNKTAFEQSKNGEMQWLKKAAAITGNYVQAGNLYAVLRSEAKKRQDINEKNRKLLEKKETLTEELEQLSSYLNELNTEKQNLLDECNAETIEEFYQFHVDWVHKNELEQELKLVTDQLEAIGAKEEVQINWTDSAEMRISELENEHLQLKNKRNQLVDEKAELQQRVTHLLTDEAYESKLQSFEEKKAEFNELARRWSVNKAIIEAIRNTMSELKEKSLPAVLEKACGYFQHLTGGSYVGMEIHPDGHFEAVKSNNTRFRIAELSQATKEQAYLALRLSLAVSMQKSHPFPIIMDDPFVHFDRLRVQQVINLIRELQKDHQFIYFTCHEDMCQAWPDAQIIDVANTGRSVYL